jgi:hypothetical protein
MESVNYVDLQETELAGPGGTYMKLKVDGQFCWINPEGETGTAAAAARRMIKEYGPGPFKCLKITRVPSGYVLLSFIDQEGELREILTCANHFV